jgi:hypothetical protein
LRAYGFIESIKNGSQGKFFVSIACMNHHQVERLSGVDEGGKADLGVVEDSGFSMRETRKDIHADGAHGASGDRILDQEANPE